VPFIVGTGCCSMTILDGATIESQRDWAACTLRMQVSKWFLPPFTSPHCVWVLIADRAGREYCGSLLRCMLRRPQETPWLQLAFHSQVPISKRAKIACCSGASLNQACAADCGVKSSTLAPHWLHTYAVPTTALHPLLCSCTISEHMLWFPPYLFLCSIRTHTMAWCEGNFFSFFKCTTGF
jgi:hypothetical protein